jgi:hypothetical protein
MCRPGGLAVSPLRLIVVFATAMCCAGRPVRPGGGRIRRLLGRLAHGCDGASVGYSGGFAERRASLLTAASSAEANRPRSRAEKAGGPAVTIPIERR